MCIFSVKKQYVTNAVMEVKRVSILQRNFRLGFL